MTTGVTGPTDRSARARAAALARDGSTGSGEESAAKLSIARARVWRRQRSFDLLAPITRLASGSATITLHAAGRRTRFEAPIDSTRGRIRIRKRVSRAQARRATGIVTIDYRGDGDTHPSNVRLRAASGKAVLKSSRPRLTAGRLTSYGTVARRARGVVRIQLVYTADGTRHVRRFRAAISNGRWKLDAPLARDLREQIGRREGTLHSYTLFTGYLPAHMRGEMRSAQVLPAR